MNWRVNLWMFLSWEQLNILELINFYPQSVFHCWGLCGSGVQWAQVPWVPGSRVGDAVLFPPVGRKVGWEWAEVQSQTGNTLSSLLGTGYFLPGSNLAVFPKVDFLQHEFFVCVCVCLCVCVCVCLCVCVCVCVCEWLSFPGGASGKEPACQCRRY